MDIKEKDNYYEKAINGDAESQNYMGLLYVKGEELESNDIKALYFFKKAAFQGHSDAMENYLSLLQSLYAEALIFQKQQKENY